MRRGRIDNISEKIENDINDNNHPPLERSYSIESNETKYTGEIIAGSLGCLMEYYDFSIFGYFSSEIADVFFPLTISKREAVFQSFVIFGVAYCIRPIGGVIFGKIGDTFGRKTSLGLSMLLMSASSLMMGLLPTYEKVGSWAIVLLVIARLGQGLSVGAQYVNTMVFTLEHKPREQWCYYGAIVNAAANCLGVLIGSLVGYFVHRSLNKTQLINYGWRIPFLAGSLVSIPAIYLKWHAEESEIDRQIRERKKDGISPLDLVLSGKYLRTLIACTLVPLVQTSIFSFTFIWLAIFMESLLKRPIKFSFLINSASLTVTGILLVFLGRFLDQFPNKSVHIRAMYIAGILMALIAPFMVMFVAEGQSILAFACQVVMGFFYALWCAPMNAWMVERFPPRIRLTAISIGYNLQSALSGFTPAFATLILHKYGEKSPGLIVSLFACISMIGLYTAPSYENSMVVEDDGSSLSSTKGQTSEIKSIDNQQKRLLNQVVPL